MRKFKRRSFGGSASRLEYEEAPPLDYSKDPAENMKELLLEITKKEQMATGKRMGYLNNFSQLVKVVPPETDFGMSLGEIVGCLRVALVSPAKEIRAAALRACRYLLQSERHLKTLMEQRIDIFISRALDLIPAFEVERVQALRLVRKITYLCPESFPLSLAMGLAAVSCDSTTQDRDRMSRACLATLCELTIKNVEVASYCGAVNVIIENILDCPIRRMNESLVVTLLYLFNHPQYRCYVRKDVGIEAVLAPFTDLYYRHNSEIPETAIKDDQKNRIEAAKMALVAICRTWPGIISLCDPESNGLDSLMGVFSLPSVEVRVGMMDALFDIFCLVLPILTADFTEALSSCDPSTSQESWKLTEGFLVDEALSLLPHRASGNRTNLVDSYLALILNAFIDAGLLESLVEVITTSDNQLSIRATILLGELLHMANTLLPPGCCGHTHCLPTLMSMAPNIEVSSSKRGKASAAVSYLDQIHQEKKRGTIPCSLFLGQIISQATLHGKHSKVIKEKADLASWKDEDVNVAIRDTQVLVMNEFLLNWDWDLINTTLDSSKLSIKKQDDQTHLKFVKRLVQFYKPSSKQFCLVEIKHEFARQLSEVGLQLIDFLLRKEEQPDGEKLLQEFIQEIRDSLNEATSPGLVMGVFSTSSVVDTVSRDYFLFIGRLSSTAQGTRVLERTPGVFQYLLEICSMVARETLLKLIISSFDYGRDGIARVVLAKALTAAPLMSRLYATKSMRVLLRAKTPYFSNWGMELLTNQLYDQENEVVAEAIDVLQEACEDEANLQRLIEIRPALLHLGEKGVILLVRYLSVSRGYTYLSEVDYVEPLVEAWKTTYGREYIRWIENNLAEALTSFQKQADEDTYIRTSNERLVKKDVYVIPHLYGELAQHRNGINLIQDKGLLRDCINTILNCELDTADQILDMKAALWSLGHIGSSNWGIPLLLIGGKSVSESGGNDADLDNVIEDDFIDIIKDIVQLAQECEVLTIRGTCFYCLGLIAKTSQGADKLEELGWECVRHRGAAAWPIIEQEITYIPMDYSTDDEAEGSDSTEDTEDTLTPQVPGTISELFGGVYLGDDSTADGSSLHAEAFEYTRITFGEDKKTKTKRRNQEEDDIKRTPSFSNFQSRTLNVDDSGQLVEQSINLYSGLERLIGSSEYGAGIYFGDDSQLDLKMDLNQTLSNLQEQQELRPSNKETFTFPNFAPTPSSNSEFGSSINTRSIFDKAGIYLGEEDIANETEGQLFDLESSSSLNNIAAVKRTNEKESLNDFVQNSLPTWVVRTPRTEKLFVSELAKDALGPIREDEGSENLSVSSKEFEQQDINISIEEITVDMSGREVTHIDVSSREVTPVNMLGREVTPVNMLGREVTVVDISDREWTPVDMSGGEVIPVNTSGREVTPAIALPNGNDLDSPSMQPASLNSGSLPSDFSSERQSPVDMKYERHLLELEMKESEDESRKRSTSLTLPLSKTNRRPEERSASFSGDHSQRNSHQRPARTGSDPGLGFQSRTGSYSSQDSDPLNFFTTKKNSHKNVDGRRTSNGRMYRDKSQLENEQRHRTDSEERSQTGSERSISPIRHKRTRKRRGSLSSLSSASPSGFQVGSLSSVPASPAYTSARDAVGYTAWTTLRKQRGIRKELEHSGTLRHSGSVTLYPYTYTLMDRMKVSERHFSGQLRPSYDRRISMPTSFASHGRCLPKRNTSVSTSIGSAGNESAQSTTSEGSAVPNVEDYVGRCLPIYLHEMLKLSPYEYKGSWADHFKLNKDEDDQDGGEDEDDQDGGVYEHSKDKCLGCVAELRYSSTPEKERKKKKENRGNQSEILTGNPKKKISYSSLPQIDPNSSDRFLVHKEVLRMVVNLSSAVASKASQQGLIALRDRYPWAFQDLCLYSQMMDQLALYSFRLSIRRFIQALFDNVNFSTILIQADSILGRSQDK